MSQKSLQWALGRSVRRVRREREISQEELAHRAGLNVKWLGEVERGRRNPGLATVAALAEALALRPSELVQMAEEHEEPQQHKS